MKHSDDIIKKSLLQNMHRINDDSFADKIIKQHLSEKTRVSSKPFFNFAQLIIGLSSILISIGLILLARSNNSIFEEIHFNEQHGLILFLLSVIYLIYKWIEGITAHYNKVANMRD